MPCIPRTHFSWRGLSLPVSFPPLGCACAEHRVAPRPVVSPWLPRSFWSSHCGPRRRQMSLVLPPILIWQSHLIVPWVFEAGYGHFAPQPSRHPCRVRSRPHRLSKLLAHPLMCALAYVPVCPSVHYLPLLRVLCRLPSHCVHARPSSHRVPNHLLLRGVLRDVLSAVCCRHCVGVERVPDILRSRQRVPTGPMGLYATGDGAYGRTPRFQTHGGDHVQLQRIQS